MLYREITACRSCGSTRLETVLDLGNLCVSDFVQPGQDEDRAPLELVVCDDCSLVQLRHTVDRDRLYRNYYYHSGTNESMVAALKDVVDDACRRVEFSPYHRDSVLDIGANDGTLLNQYDEGLCIERCGFEPSNIEPKSQGERGIFWRREFFPASGWKPAETGDKPKIITSIAMFYDVDDPNRFVSAIRDWLHPDGVWVVQFQDLHAMLACNGFDNICHEHLTYWGQYAFYDLVARHGLKVIDVSHNQTNGGSVRYIVKHGQWDPPRPEPKHATQFAYQLRRFAREAERLKQTTLLMLTEWKAQGKTVYGYGASTKGNTLLQYYGIGPELLPAIADRNPDKWGRLTVGTHIPIISEEEMRQRQPDYLFCLPWHFIDHFTKREDATFIVPLPSLHLARGDTHANLQSPDTTPEPRP
jgi:hypothetical protein